MSVDIAEARSMTPISLRLKGFRGIRDGLGRDTLELDFAQLAGDAELIAIVGNNGRGKTTLMDSMVPFMVMPSRAGADGLGSFSYYDHVYLPESIKDLVWEHEGVRYRSQLVFRMNGKKKTEAFLHVFKDDRWEPVRLDDGTVSDGKVDTYERCVEGILGSAKTYFTSVFSAQGKRQLSTYKNGEIKTLLADLLGLDKIREIGRQAAETVKLLKAGLVGIRQEGSGLLAEAQQVALQRTQLGDTQAIVNASQEGKAAAQRTLDEGKAVLAKLAATKALALQTEARRTQFTGERMALIEAGKKALAALDDQAKREAERLTQLDQRIAKRAEALQIRRRTLEQQRVKLQRAIASGTGVGRAQHRLPLAQVVEQEREQRVSRVRRSVERLEALLGNEKLALQRLAAIDREAGQAALKAQELARRLGLTSEVPCAGTELQGDCRLLADARDAKALTPSAQIQIARLEQEKVSVSEQVREIRTEIDEHKDAKGKLSKAEVKLRRARDRTAEMAVIAARKGELDQGKESLRGVVAEMDALASESVGETDEEKTERAPIEATRKATADQRESQARHYRDSLDRVEAVIKGLPPPFDQSQVLQADQAVGRAQQAVQSAEATFLNAVRDQQIAVEADKRAADIRRRSQAVQGRATAVETQLGVWTLFAKCMGNDGVIALAIDDAGPTLSGLANDLLLACYGPRFTVSIKTQVETGKGEAREGFDIVVHDGESGQSKSVTLMSGGERTWIEACLTRAIALYLAQNSGRKYETLFSDEADGPLDPERKRMFMAMKREVLRLGGYKSEVYISQTPELTAMADAVIDLEMLLL
jgi:DNA repair protein SbcC/Rad50